MAVPTTRTEFREHVLRRLGKPVIRVNVTDEQVDDRIDEAVSKYVTHHYGGSEKVYLSHQMTTQEVAEKKVMLDDTIIGVVGVFRVGFSTSPGSGGLLFNVPYQLLLSEVFGSTGGNSTGMANYVVMRTNLNMISEVIIGDFPIRYNERTDELFLDCDASKLVVGNYIIIEAYKKNDPDDYPDVWADIWLQKYATELVRKEWGQNLSKYSGAALPGGITVDGYAMIDRADRAIDALEHELYNTYSPVFGDFVG